MSRPDLFGRLWITDDWLDRELAAINQRDVTGDLERGVASIAHSRGWD